MSWFALDVTEVTGMILLIGFVGKKMKDSGYDWTKYDWDKKDPFEVELLGYGCVAICRRSSESTMIVSFIVALITAPFNIIYWIKWTITYITILLRKSFHSRRFDLYDINAFGDPVKLGYVVPQLEKELESPIPESRLQGAMDEVIFYGTNSKSECLVVRVARTCNQMADSWIYLKLADGKTLHPAGFLRVSATFRRQLPEFHMWKAADVLPVAHEEVEDILLRPAQFVFLYKASSDAYDCTLDTNPRGFASAIAKAKWKKPCVPPIEEFVDLMNLYCQTGVLTGTVSVNDESDYEMYLFGEKLGI
ncbi:uncharacterized protein CEXT_666911 [Caerostris extrusa]|uniref:Uncharacterized protein n=1 Tax=Caerostris extrusa TaxID=172846 RepID=A0AAV4U9J1_CAEEX|nr:uncharacterized protein CEXT_666911 [Caerostris extrusa]